MYYHNSGDDIIIVIIIVIIALLIAFVHFVSWVIETFKNGLKFKEVMKYKDERIAYEHNRYIILYDNLEHFKNEVKLGYSEKLKEVENLKQELQAKISLKNYELNSTMLKIYDDFYEKYLSSYEKYFYFKKNPSYKSADYIREIKADYKELQVKNKKLELLLSQFADEKERMK